MKKLIVGILLVFVLAMNAQADLVLYMDFEQIIDYGGGIYVVPDQSGYGNHGMLEAGFPGSSTALPSQTPSVNGSQALLFGYDGGVPGAGWNDVAVAYSSELGNVGQMWSMAFWARQDDNGPEWSGNYPRIISCPNYEIELGAEGDPASYFWPWMADPAWGDPASWDMTMANNPYQSWFHMVLTYDGTTFIQYINGTPVFGNNQMGPFVESTWTDPDSDWSDIDGLGTPTPLRIGTQAWINQRYLVGALDDVAIWGNCYLDADTVADLYNGVVTPLTAPCIPEPMTLSLLALGGAALLRRRK
ncbi:MAG: LamG domain-containing protein [Sedimentisphaerales bacterium]|nr:LamG domain-containing protein [Sedimentisphaerales bacterium]